MSKYTTEVRYICEVEAGLEESTGFTNVDSVITEAAPKVFNFSWPIFDENYRLPLEIKILRHFYTREIGLETVGLWKLKLQDKLNLIMPYYNKMYESQLLQFNPFYDVDITREHTRENEGTEERSNTENRSRTETIDRDTTNAGTTNRNDTNNASSHTTGLSWDLYSDTPQGGIEGINADNDGVDDNTYLTNARKVTNDDTGTSQSTLVSTVTSSETGTEDTTLNGTERNTNSGSGNITSTEDYLEHVTGKQGSVSYSKMLEEYRKTFLNIDAMIIEELEPLFFGLWE